MEIRLAVRVGPYRDFPGEGSRAIPGTFSAGGGNESVPLWISWRTHRPLLLHAGHGSALSQQTVRALAGSDRFAPDGCAGGHGAESDGETRRGQRQRGGAGR